MFKSLRRDLWKVCKDLRLRSADAAWRTAEQGAVLQRTCTRPGRNLSKFVRTSANIHQSRDWRMTECHFSRPAGTSNKHSPMSQYKTFWDRNSNTMQFLLIILWTLQSLNLFYTTHPMVLAMSWVGVQPWLFSTAKEQHFVAVVKQKYSTVILSFACIIVLRCLHVIIFGQ